MMENYEYDETFLGRWIAGELSEMELNDFKKSETYRQFNLINEESQLLRGPDINVEAALQSVKDKIRPKDKSIKTFRHWQIIAIAAVLVISLGLFINSSKTYTNDIGEIQTIILKDGSTVDLNANSSISLKRFFWTSDKLVKLDGEAFFSVNKGDDFKVLTSKGTVRVLGTKFNIKDRSVFELKCYEGKIEFSPKNENLPLSILSKNMQISVDENRIQNISFVEASPTWKNGVSKFDQTPLYLVLEELTHYFDIAFDAKNINTSRLFSGNFKHNDLQLALKSTLVPMGIKFKIEKDAIILSE